MYTEPTAGTRRTRGRSRRRPTCRPRCPRTPGCPATLRRRRRPPPPPPRRLPAAAPLPHRRRRRTPGMRRPPDRAGGRARTCCSRRKGRRHDRRTDRVRRVLGHRLLRHASPPPDARSRALNSLPLPGAVGRGPRRQPSTTSSSRTSVRWNRIRRCMIDDVVVGSVGKMAVAAAGTPTSRSRSSPTWSSPPTPSPPSARPACWAPCTWRSNPPLGERAQRTAAAGRHDPSEQLVDLSVDRADAVVAVGRRQRRRARPDRRHHPQLQHRAVRDARTPSAICIARLDTFVGTFDQQRDNIVAIDRGTEPVRGDARPLNSDVITRALNKIPPALDVLIRERPRLTTALEKLGTFSDTATGLSTTRRRDLVKNLQNLEPTIQALADVGPEIDTALAYAPTFPFTQDFIDRGVRGDYVNLFVTVDLTRNRVVRGLLPAPVGQRAAPKWSRRPAIPGTTPSTGRFTGDTADFGISRPRRPWLASLRRAARRRPRRGSIAGSSAGECCRCRRTPPE